MDSRGCSIPVVGIGLPAAALATAKFLTPLLAEDRFGLLGSVVFLCQDLGRRNAVNQERFQGSFSLDDLQT